MLAGSRQIAAASVGIVRLKRPEHVLQCQPQRREPLRADLHLVGFKLTAKGVDLHHPRNRPQLVGDHPIQDAAQLHGSVAVLPVLARRARRLALDLELIDLAQSRRNWPHLWLPQPLRDLGSGLCQPLAHQLARPVQVSPLLEDHRHRRQPKTRQATDLLHRRQPAHCRLHREGDRLLHVHRPQRRRVGQHLDLDVGHVRHCVDG